MRVPGSFLSSLVRTTQPSYCFPFMKHPESLQDSELVQTVIRVGHNYMREILS